jgi:phosphoribosylglycinamide formyltransferase, formyltetrahydrofolate-dependent
MNNPKIAIFASGTGTNFTAIHAAIMERTLHASIEVLICDQANAPVIAKAEQRGIPTFIFSAKDYKTKAEYEQKILEILELHQIEWLILAGYMRLLGDTLLTAYPQKIINIHPSLLPKYKGKDAILQAYNAQETQYGVTVHYVDAGMDTGAIIAQAVLPVKSNTTLTEIEMKIHQIEHQLFSQVLEEVMNKGVKPNEKKSIN